MFERIHADIYRVDNPVDLESAYDDWVDRQYDGEPADEPAQLPEVFGPVTVTFARDVPTGVDTCTVEGA